MDDFECPRYEQIVHINRSIVGRFQKAAHSVLNAGPLSNALQLAQATVFGQDMFPTLAAKAAKITHAIATGHVFSDGNKSTAVSVLDIILNLNLHSLQVPYDELGSMMEDLAAGTISLDEFTIWVEQRVVGPNGTS